MVRIEPFEVEQWMDQYETTPGVLNIAETCVASISIQDLTDFSDVKDGPGPLQLSKKMTYGAILGSEALRQRVAARYSQSQTDSLPAENVIITQGAIAANFLLLYTLIGPGDHVVCVYPTYQQLYSVPESLGAEVSLWNLRRENGFVPDPQELDKLVQSNTKMIIMNNPNNPTGATIPKSFLGQVVDFARNRNIIIFCDEVYRPLFHGLEVSEMPPSILSFGYERTISTSSMSKAYSLAGIRIGWIASRDSSILKAVASARDYTTISVSQLDDQVATYTLSDAVSPSLMKRNLALAKTNCDLVEKFVEAHSATCSWIRPTAGTTAFVKFITKDGKPVDDEKLCLEVLEATKVMILPGSKCFGGGIDFKGYVRIGYVCETEVLKRALEELGQWVATRLS